MSAGTEAGTQHFPKYITTIMAMVVGAAIFWGLQWGWYKIRTMDGHPRDVDEVSLGYYQVVWSNPDFALIKSADEGALLLNLNGEAAKALPAKNSPAFLIVREDDGKRVYEWASPEAPPTIEQPPVATD